MNEKRVTRVMEALESSRRNGYMSFVHKKSKENHFRNVTVKYYLQFMHMYIHDENSQCQIDFVNFVSNYFMELSSFEIYSCINYDVWNARLANLATSFYT